MPRLPFRLFRPIQTRSNSRKYVRLVPFARFARSHLPTIFSSSHRIGGNVTHVNAIAIQAPISPPYPPTRLATGPAYQAWYMPTMAPAQPIRKATSAATPSGRRFLSSHAVQSKGTPRSLRNRTCSSSMMVRKMEIQ